jgi:hypothetical protein
MNSKTNIIDKPVINANVLKYHRLQGKIPELLRKDSITTTCLEANSILLGTFEGYVHVISFVGEIIKSCRPHDKPIENISVDSTGYTIASCSDNGTVVIYTLGDEEKEVVSFNEPVKAVCLKNIGLDKNLTNNKEKKERSFIVGGNSGQLVYHRTSWFKKKDVVLFNGAGSPVSIITWRENIVAWADAAQVRLMDINTQSAICFLDCPHGVDIEHPLPCCLFWESDCDLLVGWADRFTHLELHFGPKKLKRNKSSKSKTEIVVDIRDTVAKTVYEWQCDFIISGLSTLDADNIILLGYLPPNEEDLNEYSNNLNQPEIQIRNRMSGVVASSDVLPLYGELSSRGPWGFKMVTTYNYLGNTKDAKKWHLSDILNCRGGLRGLAPTIFILSPQDLVIGKVRDVNDHITTALKDCNLALAVNLAYNDRISLKNYIFHDILTLYIEDLLDTENYSKASSELSRLIGNDVILWERWIYDFAKRDCLLFISTRIPFDKPRLSTSVYEMVIENFLISNPKALNEVVEKWGKVIPPLFNHNNLLSKLENVKSDLDNPWYLETQGKLYILSDLYENALNCYLQIPTPIGLENDIIEGYGNSLINEPVISERSSHYKYVFELIEKHSLYDCIKEKIFNLIRLSKELSANLLVRNLEKLPVSLVARQLRTDNKILHWYLHTLFSRIPEQYNTQEFADYHIMQVSLYAEFAPKFIKTVDDSPKSSNGQGLADQWVDTPELSTKPHQVVVESDFLLFLSTSTYAPLEIALKECERRRPPLYPEIIYILARMGNKKEALSLLLREVNIHNIYCNILQNL